MPKKSKRPAATKPQPLTDEEQAKLQPVVKEWDDALGTMTPEEKDEVLKTANRIRPGMVSDGLYQPCPKEKKAVKKNCVEPSGKTGISDEAKEKILTDAKAKSGKEMKADIGKLLEWEENYSGGYVPWSPEFTQKEVDLDTRKVNVLIPESKRDRGTLSGWKVGSYANNSGVTVGMGVDLGAKSEGEIDKLVDDGVSGAQLLNPEEAGALKERLKKYAGKKRSEACQYLRMNPLTLTQKEVDTLNYSSIKNHLVEGSKQYDNLRDKTDGVAFSDLGEEEQTLVLSKVYHTGSIKKGLAQAISTRDSEEIFKKITKSDREYSYLKSYYDTLPEE